MMPSFWGEKTKKGGGIKRIENKQISRLVVALAAGRHEWEM